MRAEGFRRPRAPAGHPTPSAPASPAVKCGGARSTWPGWAESKQRGACSRRFLNVLWQLLRPTVLKAALQPHSASFDFSQGTDTGTLSPWAAKWPSPWAGSGWAPPPDPPPPGGSSAPTQRECAWLLRACRLSWPFPPRACPEGPQCTCHNHVQLPPHGTRTRF